jgi:hypothetical protein
MQRQEAWDILTAALEFAPAAVLTVDPAAAPMPGPESFAERIEEHGLTARFVGRCRAPSGRSDHLLAVVENNYSRRIERAPASFNVVAVMTAYNEADIIGHVIDHVIEQGLLVYLVDNWSTDGTVREASRFLGRGLLHVEQFPAYGPRLFYEWEQLLRHVEHVGARFGSTWVMHHDADEIRRSPWLGVPLRDAIHHVDRSGFTAIENTVVDFPPTGRRFDPSAGLEQQFPGFATPHDSSRLQVKTWKNTGVRAYLAGGGHDVSFPHRRIYPYRFLAQHYPIRSQEHGVRKVLQERRPRWKPAEVDRGWHIQYDHITQGHDFLSASASAEPFELEDFYERYVVERLTGTVGDDPSDALSRVLELE